MATPHVSGLVALMLEANSSLTPADAKEILHSTSLDMVGPGVENDSGWGRIRVDRSVYAALGWLPVISNLSASPSATEGNITLNATVRTSNQTFNITYAEYHIDSLGGFGTGTPLNSSDGAFDSPSESISELLDFSHLSDGSHEIFLLANNSGNYTSWDISTTFLLDTAPPAISGKSVSLPVNQTHVKEGDVFTVEVNVSDATSGPASVTVNASPVNSTLGVESAALNASTGNWTSSLVTGGVASDNYSLNVTATDNATNSNTTGVTVWVDNDEPVANVSSPVEAEIVNGSVDVTGEANDPTSLRSWVLAYSNGSGWTGINGSTSPADGTLGTWDTSNVSDGDYSLRLTVTDGANSSNATAVNVTVDDEPPSVTVNPASYPGNHSWAHDGQNVTLNASVTDAGSGVRNVTANVSEVNATGTVELSRAGEYWTANVTLDVGANGTYRLNVTAYDNASRSNATESITVRVDNGPPSGATNVSATDAPNDESGRYVVAWNGSSDDVSAVAGYRVYTSNESFTDPGNASLNRTVGNSTLNVTLNGMTNETAWVAVAPFDLAGNENTTVTVVNVTPLDDLAPRLANVSPGNGSKTTDHAPTVSADFVDISEVRNVSTKVWFDGSNVTNSSTYNASGFTYTSSKVSDGTYTVTVSLNDSLGNAANRSWSFTVYTETSDGGGGGGSSGGGGTPAEDPDNVERLFVDYLSSVVKGEVTEFSFEPGDGEPPLVRAVRFTYDESAFDVRVELQELHGPTTLRDAEPPGKVYRHFNLYVYLPLQRPLKGPELDLAVRKSWMEDNDVEPDQLRLARWNHEEAAWELIDLEKRESVETGVVMTAQLPGFSQYAVTALEPEETPAPRPSVTEEAPAPRPSVTEKTPTPTGEEKAPGPGALPAAAAILSLALLLARNGR